MQRKRTRATVPAVTWRSAFAGRQRWLLAAFGALIALLLLAPFGWRTVQERMAPGAPSAGTAQAPAGSLGQGSSSALPFGKGSAAPAPRSLADLPEEELRGAYLGSRDKFAFYQALRDRPEPEAKYLAYRAASDCAGVLGGALDPAEVDQIVRHAVERAGNKPEEAARRRAAAGELIGACRGFLQPGSVPHADMFRLLGEAATGGHAAAQAALRTPATDMYGLVTKAIRSGDTLAFADAVTPLLRLAYTHRIAGMDASSKDGLAVRIGIEVAGCRLSSTCGPGSTRALAECAYSGICDTATPADLLLSVPLLTPAQRDLARSVADHIERAYQKRDVDGIVAPRR